MTDEEWEKRVHRYFIAFTRKTFKWSPAYRDVLKAALVKKDKSGEWYRCASCNKIVKRCNKHVDHISPVVPTNERFDGDWNRYRDRMGIGKVRVELQVLCVTCHKTKTAEESKERKKWKNKNVS